MSAHFHHTDVSVIFEDLHRVRSLPCLTNIHILAHASPFLPLSTENLLQNSLDESWTDSNLNRVSVIHFQEEAKPEDDDDEAAAERRVSLLKPPCRTPVVPVKHGAKKTVGEEGILLQGRAFGEFICLWTQQNIKAEQGQTDVWKPLIINLVVMVISEVYVLICRFCINMDACMC